MANKTNKNLVRIEHIWSVAATNVSVDQASQNVSLFNVLEQLNLHRKELASQKKSDKEVQNVAFPFRLVTFLRRIGEGQFKGDIKVEIIDPEGKSLGKAENPFEFEDSKDRLRIITEAPGLPVTIAGYYLLKVSIRRQGGDYEEIGQVPIQVVFK